MGSYFCTNPKAQCPETLRETYDKRDKGEMKMKLYKPLSSAAFVLLMLIASSPADAFKIGSHLWIADNMLPEIKNGSVRLGPTARDSYPISSQVQDSISKTRARENAFLIGVLGADLYPDLIAGQMTTHPGLSIKHDTALPDKVVSLARALQIPVSTSGRGWQTDDWLEHVRDAAFADAKARGKTSTKEIGFAFGYMFHAAMDTWAHTYVNTFTGDLFSITENQEVATRHVGIENYIESTHERFATNRLRSLGAPRPFVRKTLILNKDAANQYSRVEATQHIWAMYALWESSQRAQKTWRGVRSKLDREIGRATATVLRAERAWQTADAAKTMAAAVARGALEAKQKAETAASNAAKAVDSAISSALNKLHSLGFVNATKATIKNFVNHLPGPFKTAYNNAMNASATSQFSLTTAIATYDHLTNASNVAADHALAKLEALNLKRAFKNSVSHVRNTTWAAIDTRLIARRRNIEDAVDAYVLAWENVAKEMLRPKNDRVRKNAPITWPVRDWVICWGPALGMPGGPVRMNDFGRACTNAIQTYAEVNQMLSNLVDEHIPYAEDLRNLVERVKGDISRHVVQGLPKAAEIFAKALPGNGLDDNVAGTAGFFAALWDKHITADGLDEIYREDSSNKNLPVFVGQKTRVSRMLNTDHLPDPPAPGRKPATFQQMQDFPPFYNAVMMSRLTLLNSQSLNKLARDRGGPRFRSHYSDGKPLYPTDTRVGRGKFVRWPGRAGAALIGAIRSIDGNHQWQPVAPRLPVNKVADIGKVPSVVEATCGRYGYPFSDSYGTNQALEADNRNAHTPIGKKCSGDAYNLRKGGFRFWVDPVMRRTVFNKVFKGPLSISNCQKVDNPTSGVYQGMGCSASDPYPASVGSSLAQQAYQQAGTSPILKGMEFSKKSKRFAKVNPASKRPQVGNSKRPRASTSRRPPASISKRPMGTATKRPPRTQFSKKIVPAPSVAVARISVIKPSKVTLRQGTRMTFIVEGRNLNALSSVRIRRAGRTVAGFITTIERANSSTRSRRRITVEYPKLVSPGRYEIALYAGKSSIAIPKGTIITVPPSRAKVAPRKFVPALKKSLPPVRPNR